MCVTSFLAQLRSVEALNFVSPPVIDGLRLRVTGFLTRLPLQPWEMNTSDSRRRRWKRSDMSVSTKTASLDGTKASCLHSLMSQRSWRTLGSVTTRGSGLALEERRRRGEIRIIDCEGDRYCYRHKDTTYGMPGRDSCRLTCPECAPLSCCFVRGKSNKVSSPSLLLSHRPTFAFPFHSCHAWRISC